MRSGRTRSVETLFRTLRQLLGEVVIISTTRAVMQRMRRRETSQQTTVTTNYVSVLAPYSLNQIDPIAQCTTVQKNAAVQSFGLEDLGPDPNDPNFELFCEP